MSDCKDNANGSEKSGLFFYVVLPFGNVAPHEILLVKTENILFQNFFTSWLRQVLTSNFAARCWGHKLASELCYTTSDDGERAANLKEGIHHERDHQDKQNSGIP